MRAHIVYTPDPEHLIYLQDHLDPAITLTMGDDIPDPANYNVLVAGRPSREFITASPDLQTLIIPFAGIPATTRTLLREFPQIAVHNLHHNAPIVAETVMALLLAAAKFVIPLDRSLRAGDWTPRYQPAPSVMLAGKTALILGYGAIGQRVAALCSAFDMDVLAVRRHPRAYVVDRNEHSANEIHPPSALHDLLPRADVLIIALPLTNATTGMIGAAELALLPEKAVLVNVGRGKIVDQAALYAALKEGRLYAAASDVWYNYPPDEASRANTSPADYPFGELDNLVLSPHRGGATTDTEFYRMAYLAASLNAAAQDEAIPHQVDLEAGY